MRAGKEERGELNASSTRGGGRQMPSRHDCRNRLRIRKVGEVVFCFRLVSDWTAPEMTVDLPLPMRPSVVSRIHGPFGHPRLPVTLPPLRVTSSGSPPAANEGPPSPPLPVRIPDPSLLSLDMSSPSYTTTYPPSHLSTLLSALSSSTYLLWLAPLAAAVWVVRDYRGWLAYGSVPSLCPSRESLFFFLCLMTLTRMRLICSNPTGFPSTGGFDPTPRDYALISFVRVRRFLKRDDGRDAGVLRRLANEKKRWGVSYLDEAEAEGIKRRDGPRPEVRAR